MEFLDGLTLKHRIAGTSAGDRADSRRWRLRWPTRWTRPTLKALFTATSNPRIIFRDQARPRQKILDFGLAKVSLAGGSSSKVASVSAQTEFKRQR